MTQALGWLTGVVVLAMILTLAWRGLMGRQWLVTAPVAFIGYQSFNVFGLITKTDYTGQRFPAAWPFLVLLGFGSFVIGAMAASSATSFRHEEVRSWRDVPLVDDLKGQGTILVLLMMAGLSLLVGVLFAQRVGYNTFSQGLADYLGGSSVDRNSFSDLRANATRGTYSAAGYASQFTAILLPAIAVLLYIIGKHRKTTAPRVAAVCLGLIDVYFMTIVGGRAFLIGAVAMVALVLLGPTSPLPIYMRKRGLAAGMMVVLGLGLYGFTSVLQGRAENSGFASIATQSTQGLYERLGGDYSEQQIMAIVILEPESPVFGAHWWNELSAVAPGGSDELTFDAQLHGRVLGGNTRGNLPLDPWGSYYYNFGAPGLIVIPFIVGFLLQVVTVRYLIRGGRRLSTVILLSLAGYRFAFLIDPYSVLLGGSLTLVLFLQLITWTRKPATTQAMASAADGHRAALRSG